MKRYHIRTQIIKHGKFYAYWADIFLVSSGAYFRSYSLSESGQFFNSSTIMGRFKSKGEIYLSLRPNRRAKFILEELIND